MNCSLCVNPAAFVCKFCGRIVCQKHRLEKPYIMTSFDDDKSPTQMIVVEDATWCGQCNPVGQPVKLPELD